MIVILDILKELILVIMVELILIFLIIVIANQEYLFLQKHLFKHFLDIITFLNLVFKLTQKRTLSLPASKIYLLSCLVFQGVKFKAWQSSGIKFDNFLFLAKYSIIFSMSQSLLFLGSKYLWYLINTPKTNCSNEIISSFKDYSFIIFAFGDQERNLAKEKIKTGKLIEQHLNFNEQLDLINKLPAMITMDSANMHLASLSNTKVISIWGSTHPSIGFGPLNNEEYIIKAFKDEELNRPLSVYGKVNNQDLKKSKERLKLITTAKVIQTVKKALKN